MMFESVNSTVGNYSVMRLKPGCDGMDALRAIFPTGKADDLNFVLFSTSGVHGTCNTIEDAERYITGKNPDGHAEITFLIIHPRLVMMRYGECVPETMEDIEFLRGLRASGKIVAWQLSC